MNDDQEVVETVEIPPPRVLVLVATIPARLRSCERLLLELTKQSRKPDGVVLVLDGYKDDAPAPACPLPVIAQYRRPELSGAGARWRVANDLPPEDIVICIDDDTMLVEAPKLIERLVGTVESTGGAAAAMGQGTDGKHAPPGLFNRGDLIHALGCGLAVRAKHLVGLQVFAEEVKAAGGPDALGVLGDDDALVSAFLWKTRVCIKHVPTGNIFAASGTRTSSQTAARAAKRESLEAQKQAIKKITGWPWNVRAVVKPPTGIKVTPATPVMRR